MNKIIYNDFAANAEKNATIPASGSSNYQSCNKLLNENDRDILNFASFEGEGINLLDSSLYFAESGDNIGYVSSSMSTNSKNISNTLVIELSDGKYSAPGITFYFFRDYCTHMTLTWMNGDTVLSEKKSVYVVPAAEDANGLFKFYYENAVDGFNKIIIKFTLAASAYHFVKLAGIDLGREREITNFHSNIEIFAEIDPDCADVPGST